MQRLILALALCAAVSVPALAADKAPSAYKAPRNGLGLFVGMKIVATVGPASAFLYVADRLNCVVRRVALAGGATSTLAGSQTQCGFLDGAGKARGLKAQAP